MKLAEVILNKFVDLGVQHIFGVPGDYNLKLLDFIDENPNLIWIGTCNELNAAYAADGYAKIKTATCKSSGESLPYPSAKIAVIVTTYGVGELSAINGIAGAYAEDVPVILLNGMPATSLQNGNLPIHHTLAEGKFSDFTDVWSKFTCARVSLNKRSWIEDFDFAVSSAVRLRKPAYISIPCDLIDFEVGNVRLHWGLNVENPAQFVNPHQREVAELVFNKLKISKKPVAWLGLDILHDNMAVLVREFLCSFNIPLPPLFHQKVYFQKLISCVWEHFQEVRAIVKFKNTSMTVTVCSF